MPMTIQCSSGHAMSVGEEAQGKRVRCPQCQEVVTVPMFGGGGGLGLGGPAPASPENMGQHFQVPLPPPVGGGDADRVRGYDAPREREEPRGREGNRERGYGREREYDRGRGYDREDDRGYDRDDRREGRDGGLTAEEANQLHTVSLGLAFSSWQYLLFIIVFFLGAAAAIMAIMAEVLGMRRMFGGPRSSAEELLNVLGAVTAIVGALTLLVALIFIFIGVGMCLRAPSRTGAAPFAVVSMISYGVWFLLTLFIFFLAIANSGRNIRDGLAAILGLTSILAGLLFITGQIMQNLYWFSLGGYFNDGRARGGAIGTMIAWLVAMLISPIILIVTANLQRRGPDFSAPILFLVLIGVIMFVFVLIFAFMMGTISRLRHDIREELRAERR